MSRGRASRTKVADVHALAALIASLRPYQAIALGVIRDGLPDQVKIVTKEKLNGAAQPNDVIARSADYIVYRRRQQAFALIDFDSKGMPRSVAARIKKAGGLWPALIKVMPELISIALVIRRSTSAGLFNAETGKPIKGSGGEHIYLLVAAGSDIERFLIVLHERCWLAGFGWMMIGKGGQILERGLIDRSVGSPERLVFEGGPILRKPLKQDKEARKPIARDGKILQTRSCPNLTPEEQKTVAKLKARAMKRLEPEAAKVRAAHIASAVREMMQRTGKPKAECERILEDKYERKILSGNIVLEFADKAMKGCSVADVLEDPKRFEGKRLADPNEGVNYGRSTAMVMLRRDNGEPWIKSFAHSGVSYSLQSEDGLDYEQLTWQKIRAQLLKTRG